VDHQPGYCPAAQVGAWTGGAREDHRHVRPSGHRRCLSEQAADALLAHVDCVVGMAGSFRDAAARSSAVGCHGGLGDCASKEPRPGIRAAQPVPQSLVAGW